MQSEPSPQASAIPIAASRFVSSRSPARPAPSSSASTPGADERTIDAIRQALLEHGAIFLRDQTPDIARHKAFASRFGEMFLHPHIAGNAADSGDHRYRP